ncbi:MAG: hypothetical protein WC460_00505 [Patescibacteria group bacterium]
MYKLKGNISKFLISSLLLGIALSPPGVLAATTIGADITTGGNLQVDGGLQFTSGAANNYILSSDATGNATWISVDTSLGTSNTDSLPQGATNLYYSDAAVDARITLQKGALNGLAELDAGGKVPSGQLPAIVITNVYVVADITARDALVVQTGDVAVVLDAGGGAGDSRTYIYDGTVWQELLDPTNIYLSKANNLSDLTNVALAQTNLGLGTTDTPTFSGLILSNYLDFTPGAPPVYSEGRVFYDSTDKALTYYNEASAVSVSLGQEAMTRVYNQTGSQINNGQAVYINGANGDVPTVALAKADSIITSNVVGITTMNIPDGSYGYITFFGLIHGLNTAIYSSGDELFLSDTVAGGFTATRPNQPNISVPLGFIVKPGAGNGIVLAEISAYKHGALEVGTVAFGAANGLIMGDPNNLFWDNATKRLGIGTNIPNYTLDVAGDIKAGDGSLVLLGSQTNPDPAGINGAMYYNTSTDKFRCFENSVWKDCADPSTMHTLQSVYDNGATITTAGAVDIGFTLSSGNFTVSGAGSVDLTPTAASSFTSGDALTLTAGAASTWGTSTGNLNLQVAGAGATANVQIGAGVASATPDLLVLDLGSAEPAGSAGSIYYNSGTNKFRCYENGVWVNCISASGSAVLSGITAATAGNSINNGDNAQVWNWSLTSLNKIGLKISENSASTATGTPALMEAKTLATSTATPLRVINQGTGPSFIVENADSDATPTLYIEPAGALPIVHTGHVAIGSNFFDPTAPEKLKVDSGTEDSFNIISAAGDLNNYLQINVTNRNAGNDASSDLVATADNGDESNYYVDLGINSSGYSNPAYSIGGPDDSYLLAQGGLGAGGNLSVGTATTGTVIKFHTGGSTAADEKMRIEDSGNVGIGTTSLNARLDLSPATADALRIEPYGAVAGNTGNLELMELAANGSNYVGFKAPDSIAANVAWTLPNADGTPSQVLSTDGLGTLSWSSGATNYWQRVGTTLSPATAGDDVTTTGNISTTGVGTITSAGLLTGSLGSTISGAAISLNDNSNFNTTINTGTSTGTVTIGSANAGAIQIISGAGLTLTGGAASNINTTASDLSFQPAGIGTTANVQIGVGQPGSTTPDLLGLDVKSTAGDPASGADGAMYYNENSNKFRCHVNGVWADCDTTGGTVTLQSAYNSGATITTAGAVDLAFTLTSGNFTAAGAGSVNLTPTGASSFTSGGALTLTGGAASTWSTSSGALTLTSAIAATWGTTAGDLQLQVAGSGTTANIKVGAGGAGSATPDLFALDVKSSAGDPAGYNGAMYYNQSSNVFRCYEAGGWKDCGATGTGAATLQQSYNAGSTITTAGAVDLALTLTSGNFTATGAGSVNLTPTGASSFTSGGALTLTGGAASTWGTSAGNLALQVAGTGTTANVQIGAGGAGSTTPDLLAIDVKSDAGDPAGFNGAIYYNANGNRFRCYENGAWKDCDAGVVASLQTAYNNGGTIITNGSPIAFTLTSGDFTATGAGAVNLTPTSASSFTSGGALALTGGAASTWGTSAGNLSLQSAGTGTSANIQIGAGGAGSTTPDSLVLDIKSDAGDPAGTNGAMYYNANTNKFRCYVNGAWLDCDMRSIGTAKGDLIAYTASNTPVRLPVGGTNGFMLMVDSTQATGMRWGANLPTANSIDFTELKDAMTVDANTSINLAGKNLTINDLTGGGALSMSTNAAALTLTAGAASTWSTTAGALTINSGTTTPAALNLGSAGTNAVAIGNAGSTFALTSSGGLNVSTGGALTGVASLDTISTSATALTFAGAGSVSPGGANNLTLGSTNTTSTTNIQSGTGNINLMPATAGTTANVQIGGGGAGSATPDLLALDVKSTAGDPAGFNGAMYYNASANKFKCYENSAWKDCDTAGTQTLQAAYNGGATITTSGGSAITFTTPIGSNNAGLVINQNNSTNNPVALQITNAGTGNDITATNWSVTKAGNLSTSGNITTTGSGIITSASTLTASNGFTMTTGALGLTATSGSIGLSGLTTTSIVNTGALTLTGGAASTLSTTAGNLTLQAGSGTVSLGTSTNLTAGGALTIDSNTTSALNLGTGANAKTITMGNNTGATSLALKAGTGSILMSGQATGTSATFMGVPVKTDAGDPTTTQINGAMYYNSNSNKFRCFENSVWKDCDTSGTTTLQQAYNAGATITTAGATDLALTLASGNFTASGAGSVNLTPTGASSFTSGGALTLTGGAASTWSTSAGNLTLQAGSGTVSLGTSTNLTAGGALTIDSNTTSALNFGTGANAKTITIGNSTTTTALILDAGTGGVKIGDSTATAITNHYSATAALDFGSIDGVCTSLTITVTGAAAGDTAIATPTPVAGGIETGTDSVWNTYVSAANTVTVRACDTNPAGGGFNAASQTWRVDVWKH